MATADQLVTFAKRNQTLTIVIAGAGALTALFAFRQVTGPSQQPIDVTPGPIPSPAPAPVSGGPDTGGGGASAGIDLAALAGLLVAAQSGGAGSGTQLGQAGLQAGVDLGAAGLQAGTYLGAAGLQAGSDLGLGGLQVASDVTGYLGSALEASVAAQAFQTTNVTMSLTTFLAGLVPRGSLLPQPKPAPRPAARPAAQPTTTANRGGVQSTTLGTKPVSSLGTKPGIATPVGYRPAPKVAPKPPLRQALRTSRLVAL